MRGWPPFPASETSMQQIKYRAFTYLKEVVGRNPFLFRQSRLIMRGKRVPHFPDWNRILGPDKPAWDAARNAASGPDILIAAADGGNLPGATLESLLGAALTLRGARIHVLLCDSALPACWECDSTFFPNLR